ncbi:hypothetical protein WN944_024211 [Citrus x changshan-huyou]|uniref:Uncharacterized protein n=1 Tax=Citrus x changshan-huyou TaxID=2935761 RepID=A0AAP0LMK3_9ROSI
MAVEDRISRRKQNFSNKKSREVEARGAVCTRVECGDLKRGSKKRIFRDMKKKKDIAREMRRLAMDLGVREFYVYVDLRETGLVLEYYKSKELS